MSFNCKRSDENGQVAGKGGRGYRRHCANRLAIARRFVDEGAYVFVTGRRQKELDEAVKAIGSEVAGVRGDVSKLQDLDRLYENVKAKGKIDVLVANAGTGEFAPLASLTEEHFDKLFDVNVKGTLFTVQKALPLMNDGGSIILVGSVAR